MSDEVIAEAPAPEQVATAAPAPEIVAPEAAPEGEPKEIPKLFSQDDLDAAIGKRLAREQRKWEREAQPCLRTRNLLPCWKLHCP